MRSSRSSSPAFTLIELLIVVALIAALISITVVVGGKVIASGKRSTTENVIQILDIALQSVSDGSKGIPATVTIPEFEVASGVNVGQTPREIVWPMSDLRNCDYIVANDPASPHMINSVGLFMYYVSKSGNETAKAALSKLPQKLTGLYDPDLGPNGPTIMRVVNSSSEIRFWDGSQFELMTAFDGWGRPIRMAHPALDGIIGLGSMSSALRMRPTKLTEPEFSGIRVNVSSSKWIWGSLQVRRDFRSGSAADAANGGGDPSADSDCGQCEGATPYFYSAGADGKVGFEGETNNDEDNIYTRLPKYPNARKTYSPSNNP